MKKRITDAGIAAHISTFAQSTTSSPNNAKPNVVCSAFSPTTERHLK